MAFDGGITCNFQVTQLAEQYTIDGEVFTHSFTCNINKEECVGYAKPTGEEGQEWWWIILPNSRRNTYAIARKKGKDSYIIT
jgi:hypothetical protein